MIVHLQTMDRDAAEPKFRFDIPQSSEASLRGLAPSMKSTTRVAAPQQLRVFSLVPQ